MAEFKRRSTWTAVAERSADTAFESTTSFQSAVAASLCRRSPCLPPFIGLICDSILLLIGVTEDYLLRVSKKSAAISALIETCRGQDLDAHYLGYFECFNRRLFFEAHDVLEELWLTQRTGPNYSFYKGLIQLAGAFVHLQKNRLRPSAALFKLADANLAKYPAHYEHLNVANVRELINDWLERLEKGDFERNPLTTSNAPIIQLDPRGAS